MEISPGNENEIEKRKTRSPGILHFDQLASRYLWGYHEFPHERGSLQQHEFVSLEANFSQRIMRYNSAPNQLRYTIWVVGLTIEKIQFSKVSVLNYLRFIRRNCILCNRGWLNRRRLANTKLCVCVYLLHTSFKTLNSWLKPTFFLVNI